MDLDLREYESFPIDVCLSGDAAKLSVDYDGLVGVDEVSVELTIQKSSEQYFCQGTVSAVVRLECFRCAEVFTQNVASGTDFIFCAESSLEDDGRTPDDRGIFELSSAGLELRHARI